MTRGRAALAAALTALAVAGWIVLAAPAPAVPLFAQVRGAWRPSEARLLDRHGEVIHESRTDPRVRRFAWTALEEVAPALVAAVIESEDRRFHHHRGVDVQALAAAAAARLTGGAPRGGSTLSMQLASRLDPALERAGGPRSLVQKWRQIRAARAIEARWSKAQVLEAYLNLAPFRGETQGVAAAVGVLFGKAPHGLGAGEALVLAALLRAPNAPADAVAQRAGRLAGAIGATPADVAVPAGRLGGRDEPAAGADRAARGEPRGAGPRVALAPHAAARLLRRDGPALVRSTLDASVQRIAIEALRRQLAGMSERHVQDGAVLVVDSATGEVLAYVGSGGDLSSARWVDGVQARRQAGSTLKPFLYATALDERLLTPASLLDDSLLELAVSGGLYRPQNYDERFRGPVSLRTALASSLNVPAVRTLGLVGGEAFLARLRALGFDGVRESADFYGPALALGSADVSLWELVGAYRALAAQGAWAPLRLAEGDGGDRRRAFSPAAANVTADLLADREARSATFGLESPLGTRFWSAVKTGTSRDMRDVWCVGFSGRYTVGVWVGNFSGEPMWNVSGVTGAAPAWLEIMTRLHRDAPGEPPHAPAEVVRVAVRFAGDVEPPRAEVFVRGTEPRPPLADAAAHAPSPATAPVVPGTADRPVVEGVEVARAASLREPVSVVPAAQRSRIVAPVSGTIVAIDPDIPPARQRLLFEARAETDDVRWVLDGADLGPATTPALWAPRAGRHRLTLVDGSGRVHDGAEFVVKGGLRAPP